ncbi:uncharacterized protein LOC120603479 isoform X2 [Pteropus medius]|uniref:uncharacterized protein LOC120603479 isoform X2 n=1 Tax=Pteropus vampyrus TaxID=132908 RepID=UPI00196AEB1B|nr:uncharacterized protein LOC120603479 isoform X2 [Pteropus giganteus]XP_039719853.1 uncharacterized protein LOC120603479 isoform X2 [Pteropus giganteus]XP_039719854.1 uncharacterized protein LOC120603479 isoform X2 [Pteropus giganteus]
MSPGSLCVLLFPSDKASLSTYYMLNAVFKANSPQPPPCLPCSGLRPRVPGETNSKQAAGTGLSVFIHLPVQMGKPSQGWSGGPGARACGEHHAATCRRLTQNRAPSAGFRGAGVFVASAFVFQAPAEATAAKRPAVAAPVSRSTVCEQRHLHKTRNFICRIKSFRGCNARSRAPWLWALPGAGKPRSEGPGHPAALARRPLPGPAETAVGALASADSSTLFTQAWERDLGTPAAPPAKRGRSQAVAVPSLGSQPSPQPRTSIPSPVRTGVARMSPGLPPLGSSLPEGCARGPPKGLSECGLRCPFPELFSPPPLFWNPSQQPLEAG